MIRDGLVSGNYRQPPDFLKHNLKLVNDVMELESRTRRRDLLVDEESMVRFTMSDFHGLCQRGSA